MERSSPLSNTVRSHHDLLFQKEPQGRMGERVPAQRWYSIKLRNGGGSDSSRKLNKATVQTSLIALRRTLPGNWPQTKWSYLWEPWPACWDNFILVNDKDVSSDAFPQVKPWWTQLGKVSTIQWSFQKTACAPSLRLAVARPVKWRSQPFPRMMGEIKIAKSHYSCQLLSIWGHKIHQRMSRHFKILSRVTCLKHMTIKACRD